MRSRKASASPSSSASARPTLPSAIAAAALTLGSSGLRADGGGRGARDVVVRERPQRQQPATRADRRQHARGRMTDEQQQGAARRLLEHLEQRVGAGGIQLIDRVDDRDAPAALPGGRAEKRHRAAHVIDLDVLAQIAGLFIDRALQHQEVALRLRGDAPRHRMRGVDVERRCIAHGRRLRIGIGQDETRHAIGQRRLADAGRTADQPGMRKAAAAIGVEQRLLGFPMAEQEVVSRGCRGSTASVSASLTTRCFRARPARSPDRAGR